MAPAASSSVDRSSWADPAASAVALAGWLVRGGLLVILLPLLSLPSPVGLSVLVGPDIVDANGISARIRGLLALTGLVVAVVVALALLASAWLQRAAAERASAHRRAAARTGAEGAPADRPWLGGLMAIGLVALLPIAAALAAAAGQIVSATTAELIFPSRVDLPLAVRVAQEAWSGVAMLAVAIVVADLFHAVAVRRYLSLSALEGANEAGSRAGGAPGRRAWVAMAGTPAWVVRHPLRAGLAVVLGWAVTLATSGLTILGLTLTWSSVSAIPAVHLGPGDPARTVTTAGLFALATLGLVAVLGLCLVLLALAALVRGSIWRRAVGGGA